MRAVSRETTRVHRAAALVAATLMLLPLACGSSDETDSANAPATTREETRTETQPAPEAARATCPSEAADCRSASGRIIYVEAVDPDGDGDAHFVLLSDQSVTGPGISVVDVERGLRPHPLPDVGDEVSAAGPVYTGSYGQRQIQA